MMSRAATFSLFHPGISSGWSPAWRTHREANSYMCQPADIHTQTHTETQRHTYTQTMCHTASDKALPPAAPTFGLTADTGTDGHVASSSLAGRGRRLQVQHTHK